MPHVRAWAQLVTGCRNLPVVGEGWERAGGGVPDRPPRASRSGAPQKAAAGVSATGSWRGGLGGGRGGGPVSGEWPTWHACHARPQRPTTPTPPPPQRGAGKAVAGPGSPRQDTDGAGATRIV